MSSASSLYGSIEGVDLDMNGLFEILKTSFLFIRLSSLLISKSLYEFDLP